MGLIHVTDSVDNLLSIIQNGLVYIFNRTGVLDELLSTLKVVPSFNPGGMICLTDAPCGERQTARLFGDYGIHVRLEWAVAEGARQVTYIDPHSDQGKLIREKFEMLRPRPQFLNAGVQREAIESWVAELCATKPTFSQSGGASAEFLELLDYLDFTQDSSHQDEREWRIRFNKSPLLASDPRSEQVTTALNIARHVPGASPWFVLPIPRFAVLNLLCPKRMQSELKSKLKGTDYESVSLEELD